jgi:hypothetical protein
MGVNDPFGTVSTRFRTRLVGRARAQLEMVGSITDMRKTTNDTHTGPSCSGRSPPMSSIEFLLRLTLHLSRTAAELLLT